MIYVDTIVQYPACNLRSKEWCHMATDGDLEELHLMAARLGLRRSWFQATSLPHYDVTPGKRVRALRLGAASVGSVELAQRCFLRCQEDTYLNEVKKDE